jgi:CRISPR-associated endonuclease Csn1
MQALIRLGFFPEQEQARAQLTSLDPYELRQRGLDEKLRPEEFARALFHLNQRRGFKSNRKADKKDSDSGLLKQAISKMRERLATDSARTVGEWLAHRHAKRESVRARLRGTTVKDKAYDFYVDRGMIEAEFDALWARQAELQADIFTEPKRAELKDILLHQRLLKPVRPGRCTLIPEEERAPLALPSVQRFRLYQEVNNLRILTGSLQETVLTRDQRDTVISLLESKGEATFASIRKMLKLPGATTFNLEDAKREKLKGNTTSALLAKPDYFGVAWRGFDHVRQETIVSKLLDEASESALIAWLQQETGIDEAHAENIANARLADGYGNLGRTAISRILPLLQAEVLTYDKAAVAAGFSSHSALSHAEGTGEIMTELPYYGEALQRHVGFGTGVPEDPAEKRYGRIANPTVHIGLNQVRIVVNALIKRYGHPAEVVVEVARELKQGREKRLELQKEQKARQDQNERWRAEIKAATGIDAKPLDLQRMRLWVELNPHDVANRCCPYTGEPISIARLFSEEVEVEHILPFARTLDDSLNNRTVALRRANRDKCNQTPFEAFGHSPPGYDYAAVLERARSMPREKAKRFAPDAYEKWLRDDKDFLARALNDTAYLSRVAKEYLSLVCPPNRVRAIPGRLTAMLRGKFELNSALSGNATKNREDHRHHAIDAAVIAVTDQGLLQRFARANRDAQERGLHRLVEDMPLPWPRYRMQVINAIERVLVSHKPDHGYQGGLHNETALGLRGGGMVAHRVPIDRFTGTEAIEKAVFADANAQRWLLENTRGLAGKELAIRLQELSRRSRHVRVLEKLKVLAFTSKKANGRHGVDDDGQPAAYKGYQGNSNYCIEIVLNEKGKWEGDVISTFDAYQIVAKHGESALRAPARSRSGLPLVMRLMINDTVVMEVDGHPAAYRIAVIPGSGQMSFAQVNEANVDSRNRDKADTFKYITKYPGSLMVARGRRATISPIGALNDPGFTD